MTTHELETVTQVWPRMAPLLFVPQSERDYDHLIEMLDTLIDVVGEAEDHPLASLMDIISVLVEKYEDEHVPELI
jgi:HTH-type transcriptional regulator/antitoxin HigA